MVARIPPTELALWRAFYKLNPWGPEAQDVRAARQAAISAGDPKLQERFMMGQRPPPPVVETAEEMRTQLAALGMRV